MRISYNARSTRAATAPRFATTTLLNIQTFQRGLSVARRPHPHQMLADALGHAQLVDVEHADQVVARLGGKYHGLRGEHGRKSPHVGALLDFSEPRRIVRVARFHAV